MPTICPKCSTMRPADATVPDWQCPACGVAYAKAGGDAAAMPAMQRRGEANGGAERGGRGASLQPDFPWGKLLAGIVIVACVGLGWQKWGAGSAGEQGAAQTASGLSRSSHVGSNPNAEQLAQLAASTQSGDVLMYSAVWCPNCTQAKGWMDQYGFKYQVCDIDTGAGCKAQLQSLDPQGGVPYLVVKGHHMKDGFDSDEFVAALAK